jgi:hypothetical protein
MAGNRCSKCERFVSLDCEATEPEIVSEPEVRDNESVSLEVRAVLCCADCGEEIKEYNTEIYDSIPTDTLEEHKALLFIDDLRQTAKNDFLEDRAEEDLDRDEIAHMEELMNEAEESAMDGCEFEAEVTSISVSEAYGGKGRKGFRKKFYTIDVEITLTCSKHDDFSSSFNISERVQASHFDEIY